MENIRLAYKNAKSNKNGGANPKKKQEILRVEQDLENNLLKIQQMLLSGEYRTQPYSYFELRDRGKIRQVAKLPFYPDRIIHWAIIQPCEKRFLSSLIDQTYAALPNRGTHKALYKTKQYASKRNAKYCLKIDIKKYFESISKDKLMEILSHLIKDKKVLELFYTIIYDYPGLGLPIGNYTSQYLANLYLSPIDHYMKEVYHCKYYVRYMDDIVIMGWNKGWLKRALSKLRELTAELSLTIKSNWQIFPTWVRGLDFVGYKIYYDHVLLRQSTKKRMKRCCKLIELKLKSGSEVDSHILGCLSAYNGILMHCNAKHLFKHTLHKVYRMIL